MEILLVAVLQAAGGGSEVTNTCPHHIMKPLLRLLVCLGLAPLAPPAFAAAAPSPPAAPVNRSLPADSTLPQPGIVKAEALFDHPPHPQCHALTMAETGEGLVAAWFGGTQEGKQDVGIWVSPKNGKVWQAALVLESEPYQEFSYPAVMQTSDGLVHVIYTWKRQTIRRVVVDPEKLELRDMHNGQWPG